MNLLEFLSKDNFSQFFKLIKLFMIFILRIFFRFQPDYLTPSGVQIKKPLIISGFLI
ncbi:hypothetical protein P872_00310 [Rhodonellum psychrophilum GCM71 = DSM 17998]|uniref:Uncharacterized protein n=2 Tax=Rhodonellum TaxID=336827 RepID=U5C5R7_9BACT|nr:hypothetical protein P872_00310 [Rhodonellum psychrophilum GCM71 = DSM 17998]SDY52783.1 hypothetical protein SAMN05444412_101430 [Rhodonellum ikkaensis]